MSSDQGCTATSPQAPRSGEGNIDNYGQGAVVNQVFSLFKDYLENLLETKTKEIEKKTKIDKEVVQLKFRGNQKQFELNAGRRWFYSGDHWDWKSTKPAK